MKETILIVGATASVLLALVIAVGVSALARLIRYLRRDRLMEDLCALPAVHLACMRNELSYRQDLVLGDRSVPPQNRPFANLSTLLLLLEMKLRVMVIRDKLQDIRIRHRADIAQLRRSFDELLQQTHGNRDEAQRLLERNEKCLHHLRVTRIIAFHADAEAEHGMRELRLGLLPARVANKSRAS
jgi:hypothetical protein